MEHFITLFIALIVAAVTYGTPLLFGTLGEVLTEKSGNLNLGVEGIMFMGGAFGLGGVFYYEKLAATPNGFVAILVGILFAFLAGALASLIFSFITTTLRANQNVTGLALSIFGTGVGQFMGEFMRVREGGYVAIGNELKTYFIASPFPKFLQEIPYVGKVLFSHSFFFYLAVLLAVGLYCYLMKSRSGLYLRAVGESPATADAAGINVTRYKYLATIIGGGISAVGGMVYITTIAGCVWNHEGRPAGRCAGHLLHLASAVRHLGLCPLRRTDDPVSASAAFLHPHAALQDPALRRDGHRPCRFQYAQQQGKAAARSAGSVLLPRRPLNFP